LNLNDRQAAETVTIKFLIHHRKTHLTECGLLVGKIDIDRSASSSMEGSGSWQQTGNWRQAGRP
jgi:hypothetical protein